VCNLCIYFSFNNTILVIISVYDKYPKIAFFIGNKIQGYIKYTLTARFCFFYLVSFKSDIFEKYLGSY